MLQQWQHRMAQKIHSLSTPYLTVGRTRPRQRKADRIIFVADGQAWEVGRLTAMSQEEFRAALKRIEEEH